MKATTVLLRWYKSFNVNYVQYADQGVKTKSHPWNLLRLPDADESDLPFIEIPLETDITTVVGANESGKSHLLSAISKVITGSGLSDSKGKSRPFDRTDLCHYSSIRSKNADAWPHIGLEFSHVTSADVSALSKAVEEIQWKPDDAFTFVIAPEIGDTQGFLFHGNQAPAIPLDRHKVEALRACLPKVLFIQSHAELSDHVHVADVLAHFNVANQPTNGSGRFWSFDQLRKAAETLFGLSLEGKNQLSEASAAALTSTKQLLVATDQKQLEGQLEAKLFRVLEINAAAIEFLAQLTDEDRSYAESLVETWNDEIESVLNLSRYWQQDDHFRIRMDYKRGTIYFEITDKTNAVYTFGERSSGLKYFLSYYIQAKAIQLAVGREPCIILMDEPDSYLSIAGQRNLLAVFESLVSADSSLENAQLLYTTHSPFLINRNFHRRIRLVRKGDAEEGTQYVGAAHVRRYEPVRSALGIDCAQMLFMGATNLIVEGTTDQYLLSELVRYFARPDNISELLDLNAVVLTSAQGAGGAEQLLAASQWGDEPPPATLVLLDSDKSGQTARDRITGVAKKSSKLIDPDFVILLSEAIPSATVTARSVVTIEDLLPMEIYAEAMRRYLQRWHAADLDEETESKIANGAFGASGVVEDAKLTFEKVTGSSDNYDKIGVLRAAVEIINSRDVDAVDSLRARFFGFCEFIRHKIDRCEHAQQLNSSRQAIKRIIHDFLVIHRESSMLSDMALLIGRLEREAEGVG